MSIPAVAQLAPVTQVILSVVGLLAGGLVTWGIREVVRVFRAAGAALDRMDQFTQAAVAQMAATAEIDAITRQLGTLTRRADLQPLEDYIHDFRHDWANSSAIQQGLIATQVKMLERTSDVLDALTAALGRLPTIEERPAPASPS